MYITDSDEYSLNNCDTLWVYSYTAHWVGSEFAIVRRMYCPRLSAVYICKPVKTHMILVCLHIWWTTRLCKIGRYFLVLWKKWLEFRSSIMLWHTMSVFFLDTGDVFSCCMRCVSWCMRCVFVIDAICFCVFMWHVLCCFWDKGNVFFRSFFVFYLNYSAVVIRLLVHLDHNSVLWDLVESVQCSNLVRDTVLWRSVWISTSLAVDLLSRGMDLSGSFKVLILKNWQ